MIELLLANWLMVAGEWDGYNLSPKQRQWFHDAKPPGGAVRCCDIADGHPATDWKVEDGHYLALFRGRWWNIPDEAVIHGPAPAATIWMTGDFSAVRCFAPGSEG